MYFTSKINPVFYIAEVGSNHEGSYAEAKRLVINACASDADVVKLQIFKADNLVSKKFDNNRYEHFKRLELSVSQNIDLCKIIKLNKKLCSASIWDVDQIEVFKKYIDIYKIGSGDIHNFQIIKKIISLRKPIIISTGLSSMLDIKETLNFINKLDKNFIKSGRISILHCNTAYPTPKEDSYLGTINYLKNFFNLTVGFSDHSIGDEIITYAFIARAKIIEKHFSNNPLKKTFRDHLISLDKKSVNKFLAKIRVINEYLQIKKNISSSERMQKNFNSFRRSIYVKKNIKKNEFFSEKNIISLRPYKKISSKFFFNFIGKKSKKNYKQGQLINEK